MCFLAVTLIARLEFHLQILRILSQDTWNFIRRSSNFIRSSPNRVFRIFTYIVSFILYSLIHFRVILWQTFVLSNDCFTLHNNDPLPVALLLFYLFFASQLSNAFSIFSIIAYLFTSIVSFLSFLEAKISIVSFYSDSIPFLLFYLLISLIFY